MLILGNTLYPTQGKTGPIECRESIESLIIKVMFPRTAQNLHNLMAGKNCLADVTLKNTQSISKVSCNNFPLRRAFQFDQYRKGLYQYLYDGNNDYIGFIGAYNLTEEGSLRFSSDNYLEIKINELPANSRVSIQGLENENFTNKMMIYEQHGIPAVEGVGRLQLDDKYETMLLSCSGYIEREYTEAVNSFPNPMSLIQMLFTEADKVDVEYNHIDIRAKNIRENGNDIVATWCKSDNFSDAFFGSVPLLPRFMYPTEASLASDLHGIYLNAINTGFDDWGLLDLRNVDAIRIKKNQENEYPYFTERLESI